MVSVDECKLQAGRMAADTRVEEPEVLPLFPTPVWKTAVAAEISAPLDRFLENYLRDSAPTLAPGEAWQSGHDVHRLVQVAPLVTCIETAVERVLEGSSKSDRVRSRSRLAG